ncbi:hypothetical protein RHCRD62_70119 [Rhodococcus sp. RD6.2]|nr:hypothetical protein RHCRD62_70119 [Rhodococcus sp. RD6.2]
MGPAVLKWCASNDFALDEACEYLSDPGRRAVRVAEVERGDTVRLRTRAACAPQRDHEVRVEGVGRLGPLCGRRIAVRRVRQERLHPGRRHPAFESVGDVPQDLGLGDRTVRRRDHDAGLVAAEIRVDHDALAAQLRSRAANRLLLGDRVRRTTGDAGPEQFERPQRLGAADAVRRDADLPLERRQPLVRLRTEIPVDAARVEAEILQLRLQCRDVVAELGSGQLVREGAGPEAVRRLTQRAVRGGADDPVDEEATLLLECTDGAVQMVVEHSVGSSPLRTVHGLTVRSGDAVEEIAQVGKGAPNLGNGVTVVAVTESMHSMEPFLVPVSPTPSGVILSEAPGESAIPRTVAAITERRRGP